MITFKLPWPPSINNYWRKNRNGMYITKAGKEFRNAVYFECSQYRHAFNPESRLVMRVLAFPPDNRRRDLDNIFKSLCDALEKAKVFDDDNQIDEIYIKRRPEKLGLVSIELAIVS